MLSSFTRLRLLNVTQLLALAVLAGCNAVDSGLSNDERISRISPDSLSLIPGQTVQFFAYGDAPLTGSAMTVPVRWTASGGTITNDGTYTADAADGVFEVTATDISGRAARARIWKRPRVRQIVLVPAVATVGTGNTLSFAAYGLDSNGDSVGVSVTYNATGGLITATGLYTAGQIAGSFRVIATAGRLADTSAVTVTNSPPPPTGVKTVEVTPATANVTANTTFQLHATTRDSSGNALTGYTITWSSSNPSAATVDAAGLVRGMAAGSAIISAVSEGKTGTSSVTVSTAPVATVQVSPSAASITQGSTQQLSVTLMDAAGSTLTGRTVTWSSSATGVATVSGSGLVTAAGAGSAIISATSEGVTGTATITVSAIPVATVQVSPSTATVNLGSTQQLSVTVRDAGGNTLTGRTVTWSSSATGVATVSSSGLVTAVASGSATITATSEGKSGTMTVTVPQPTSSAAECASRRPEWIWCDDFEQNRLASYFEYDNAGGNFTLTSGVGVNGSSGMRGHFNQGAQNAGSLHLAMGATPSSYFRPVDGGTAKYREIYWRMYVKDQAGWVGGGGDKMSRAFVFATSSWSQAAIGHVWSGTAPSPDIDYLLVDPVRGTDASGNLVTTGYNDFANFTWLGQGKSTMPMFDASHVGQWYCVEAHMKLNSSGNSDGVLETWINGTQQATRTGLNYLGSYSQYGINAVYFENYWNAGSSASQDRFFDNIVVSTARIGC
jgi:uncharacterized protein YjdB